METSFLERLEILWEDITYMSGEYLLLTLILLLIFVAVPIPMYVSGKITKITNSRFTFLSCVKTWLAVAIIPTLVLSVFNLVRLPLGHGFRYITFAISLALAVYIFYYFFRKNYEATLKQTIFSFLITAVAGMLITTLIVMGVLRVQYYILPGPWSQGNDVITSDFPIDIGINKIVAKLEIVNLKSEYNFGDEIKLKVTLTNNTNEGIQPSFNGLFCEYYTIKNRSEETMSAFFTKANAATLLNACDSPFEPLIIKPGESVDFKENTITLSPQVSDSGRIKVFEGINPIYITFRFYDFSSPDSHEKPSIKIIESNRIEISIKP